jgi:hypothetical protein
MSQFYQAVWMKTFETQRREAAKNAKNQGQKTEQENKQPRKSRKYRGEVKSGA